MTKPKKKAAPKPEPKKLAGRPSKIRGWLRCDRCTTTAEFASFGAGPLEDGGWPMHRCGFEVRPFDTWSNVDPKPPLPKTPPSPLEY